MPAALGFAKFIGKNLLAVARRAQNRISLRSLAKNRAIQMEHQKDGVRHRGVEKFAYGGRIERSLLPRIANALKVL